MSSVFVLNSVPQWSGKVLYATTSTYSAVVVNGLCYENLINCPEMVYFSGINTLLQCNHGVGKIFLCELARCAFIHVHSYLFVLPLMLYHLFSLPYCSSPHCFHFTDVSFHAGVLSSITTRSHSAETDSL